MLRQMMGPIAYTEPDVDVVSGGWLKWMNLNLELELVGVHDSENISWHRINHDDCE